MEIESRVPSTHSHGPTRKFQSLLPLCVVVLYVVCSVPHLVSFVLLPLDGVLLLACQISLDPLGMSFRRLLRGVT